MAEPRQITEMAESVTLIEQCADFAAKNGIVRMLDVIAGVTAVYARVYNDPSIHLAYDPPGVDLDGALPFQ